MILGKLDILMQKNKARPLYYVQKFNQKWIEDLKVRPETKKS